MVAVVSPHRIDCGDYLCEKCVWYLGNDGCWLPDQWRKPKTVFTKESVMVAFAELENARQFCDVLRQQADAAVEEGIITRREHRLIDLFSRLRPRKTREVMERVREEAIAAGVLKAETELAVIDWETLLEFIKQIMPFIIELIQALILGLL